MRLTGKGVWGPPEDLLSAQAVLRHAIELGINFIDTADVYGPGDNERLIRDTLQPYPANLVIATKGGMVRSGPATPDNHRSAIDNSEAHLRQAIEGSLRDLGMDHIDLYQLHRVDPRIPIEDTMGVLGRLQTEGKYATSDSQQSALSKSSGRVRPLRLQPCRTNTTLARANTRTSSTIAQCAVSASSRSIH